MSWEEIPLPQEVELLAAQVRHAAQVVHREVGPGYREAAYQACFVHLLRAAGHRVEEHKAIDLVFRGLSVPNAGELDVLVDGCVVVELKAREAFHSTHLARTLSYVRATGADVGLLFNFHAPRLLKHGYQRVVHPRYLKWV